MVLPASDRRKDLIWAYKQLWGPKLSMCSPLSEHCPSGHAHCNGGWWWGSAKNMQMYSGKVKEVLNTQRTLKGKIWGGVHSWLYCLVTLSGAEAADFTYRAELCEPSTLPLSANNSLFFLFVPNLLYIYQPCQSEWYKTKAEPLYNVWRGWLVTPLFLSWWELFLSGKVLLGREQCQLGKCDNAAQMKFSFASCVIILSFVVVVVVLPCCG